MESWRHIKTAVRLFFSMPILYLLMGAIVAYGILFSFGLLAGPLIGGFVHVVLVHRRTGRRPTLGDITSGFQSLGNLLLLSLLLVVAGAGTGFFLPVLMAFVWWSCVPIAILLVSLLTWWMYVPALIVDKRLSLWRAMRESRMRVTNRGGFFPHLGFMVSVFVLPPLAIFALSKVFPPVGWLDFVVCPFQFLALASAYDDDLPGQGVIQVYGSTGDRTAR